MKTIGEIIFQEMWDCEQADHSPQLERIYDEASEEGKQVLDGALQCLCGKTWAELQEVLRDE